jgi:diguanylate cyclase (GGDEF)-like protein
VSINGVPIRILLIGEAKDACRLRTQLDPEDSTHFHIAHVPDLELAVERLASDPTDVLLLHVCSKQGQGHSYVQAARAAAPDVPMVVLAEAEDDTLAINALREGVQDFLAEPGLDRPTLVRALRYAIERHRLQRSLRELSLIDDLTGLHNRRGFMALAEQHLRMIKRKGAALLIYIDVDDLKRINDSHGHQEGNRALSVTSNVLRACFRQSDILARLGGDEFCVLMTDAGQDSVQQVRKRLQFRTDYVNGLSSWSFRLSLSVGIANVPVTHQPPLEQLLLIADGCMYEEKRNKLARQMESLPNKQSTVA